MGIRLINLIISAVLFISCSVKAPIRAPSSYSNYEARREIARFHSEYSRLYLGKALGKTKGLAMGTAKTVGNPVSHGANTLLIIFALTGFEIMKFEGHIARMSGTRENFEETLSHITVAGKEMISGAEIWGAMIGAGTVGSTLAGSVQMIQKLNQSSAGKNFFKGFLNAGVLTFASFAGWEFGTHLVQMARHMIVEPKVYKAAGGFAKLHLKRLKNPSALKAVEKQALAQMWDNMVEILKNREGLLGVLIDQTWQNGMATGELLTLIGFLAAGGVSGAAIGSQIGGGLWGWLIGGAIGTGSLFAYSYIEEERQNMITRFLKFIGYKNDSFKVGTVLKNLSDLAQRQRNLYHDSQTEIHNQAVSLAFKEYVAQRSEVASDLLKVLNYNYLATETCSLDRALVASFLGDENLSLSQILSEPHRSRLSRDQVASIDYCVRRGARDDGYIQAGLDRLEGFYQHNIEMLKQIMDYNPHLKNSYLGAMILVEVGKLEVMDEWARNLVSLLADDSIPVSENPAQTFLAYTYVWPFDENTAIETLDMLK